MYRNLEAELARAGISKNQLAVKTGIPYSTLLKKLNGGSQFLFSEIVAIKEVLGVDMVLEILFSRTENQAS